MSVNLKTLPFDEEVVRLMGIVAESSRRSESLQNVLDALNWFRCLAIQRENELRECRESAEHNRIFGVNA